MYFFCTVVVLFFFFFFFQAEDGIRDRNVTGVQTCALPIWLGRGQVRRAGRSRRGWPGGRRLARLHRPARPGAAVGYPLPGTRDDLVRRPDRVPFGLFHVLPPPSAMLRAEHRPRAALHPPAPLTSEGASHPVVE